MSSLIELAYGKGHTRLRMDPARFAPLVILPQDHPPMEDPHGTFLKKAATPIEAPPLGEIVEKISARSSPRVVIVIADHTRPVPDRLLVPWIVEALGVEDSSVTLLVGTGTHRPSTDRELDRMLGGKILSRFKVVNHDCCTPEALVHIGKSTCGGPCLINRYYVEADVRIATGFIEPHFFAGFSGGAKAIVPGIAGLETVLHLHRAAMIAHPNSTWGELKGNPTLELTREFVSFCPPDFIVNVTLNLQQEITDIFVGHFIRAHEQGCVRTMREACTRVPRTFPLVVTTNSGYPLDMDYYQTVKGLCAAARITAAGGVIVAASECSQGIPGGSMFERILSSAKSSEELLDEIMTTEETSYDQWQVQSLLQVLLKHRVYLFSSLGSAQQLVTRVRHVRDLEEILLDLSRDFDESPLPIAVLPRGPLTIPIPPSRPGISLTSPA